MSTLDSTAPRRRGAIALLGAQWGKYALQVGGIVILARLIDPGDFGLVALGLALSGFAAVLGDFGLSLAALRAPTLSVDQRDMLFWINTLIGAVASLLVVAAAVPVSAAFGDERLAPVMALLAPAFALRSASVQYRVELNRAGRLSALALVEVVGDAIGLVTAAVLALCGYGVLGLTLQGGVAAAITLIAAVTASPWCPRRPRRDVPLRSLLTFGGNTFAVHLVNYASSNIGTMAVGAASGSTVLGLFSRANQLVNLPLEQVASPLTRIVIPTLVDAGGPAEIQRRLSRFQIVLCYPVLAYLSLLAAAAAPAIHVVLGSDWTPAADDVTILAVGAVFQTLGYVAYWAFLATGRPGLLLGSEGVGRSLMIALSIVFATRGPMWVASAIAVGHLAVWLSATLVFLPRAGVSGWALARAAGPALLVFGLSFAAARGLDSWLLTSWEAFPRLMAITGSWGLVVVIACALFAKSDIALIRGFIRSR